MKPDAKLNLVDSHLKYWAFFSRARDCAASSIQTYL